MKTLRTLFTFLVGISFVVAVGIYCARSTAPRPIIRYIEDTNKVYNIFEMQERLQSQGLYKGKIDGIWGPQTDRTYCDYCAIKEIEGE